MSEGHAYCSPSGWDRWSVCAGAPAIEEQEPDVSSPYAAEGTLAHEWAAKWLSQGGGEVPPAGIPEDMVAPLRLYVNAVQERIDDYRMTGAHVTVLIEQKLDIEVITAERGAKGTGDVVLLAVYPDYADIDVWDLKYGQGVAVSPVENGQEMIYALAAVAKHGLVHTFREVHLFIHQPRLSEKPQQWTTTLEDLYVFGAKVTQAAALSLSLRGDVAALSHLVPGDTQCRFCRAKYRCPALRKFVHEEAFGDFQSEEDPHAVPVPVSSKVLMLSADEKSALLSRSMKKVQLIEEWCLDVRAAVDRALQAGERVPGFKLVTGRAGPRAWIDKAAKEQVSQLVSDVPDAFSKPELISPTQLEKVLEAQAKEDLWPSLKRYYRQSPGKPSVAPETDNRAPITTAAQADDFEAHDVSHLV